MRSWRLGLVLVAAMSMVSSFGCEKKAGEGMTELDTLKQENEKLKGDVKSRDDLLAEAGNRENSAQKSIEQLRRELDEARANGGKTVYVDRPVAAPAAAGGGKAEGWVGMPGFDMISIPGDVLFDSGKNTLRTSGRGQLDRIVSDIRGKYSDRDIYVFGHTDNDPIKKSGWKDNWELGAQRSLTVARFLIAGGIPGKNVIAASAGEYRPRDANTGKAKERNRRVEFYAVKHQSGGTALSAKTNPGE